MAARDDKVDAWMPMFPRDFLAATEGLSAVDGWAYTRLLLHAWLEHGYLEFDANELARLAKVTPMEWLATWKRLARFWDLEAGRISQRRQLYELDQARLNRARRREAGQVGADVRWSGQQRKLAAKQTRTTRSKMRSHPPAPSPSPSESEEVTRGRMRSQCPSPSPSPEQIPPTPRRRGESESPDFVVWWDAYPRKAARDRAWRAWQRTAAERPPLPEMLRTLEWQRRLDFDRRPPDRVPYPAKYLHDGSYRDEPPRDNGASSARPPPRGWICPYHRQVPARPASEQHPDCSACKRLGPRRERRGSEQATPAAEIAPRNTWPPKEEEVQH